MYKYKINKITFNDGSEIIPGELTIIVGPNNCGKSRILRDIKSLTSDQNKNSVVVTNVEYSIPDTVQNLTDAYKITTFKDNKNNLYLRTLSSDLISQHNIHVGIDWEQNCQNWLTRKDENTRRNFSHWFGSFFVSLFETEDRLKIIKETQSSEKGQTTNLLQAFYYEGTKIESKLRSIVKEAFKKDIRLDYSTLRSILFRIGEDLENAPKDPRDAISYYEKHEKLDEQGDGLRSFVATLLAILVGRRPVLLLDEPESFLHPPQAFRLGEVVADHAVDNRQVVVATHSADFLRGILSKRQNLTILRVDRNNTINNISVLDSKNVASISNDPLLSSTRIMDGLFYKGSIIVEADADAVFYQRISRQLNDADNFHIAHAHNKQTVAKVVPPYRLLNIPFATIVDFDVFRVRDEFLNLLKQIGIPPETIEQALEHRHELVKYIEAVDPKEMLNNMIDGLKEEVERIIANEKKLDDQSLIKELAGNLKRIRESGSSWKKYKKEGVFALDDNSLARYKKLDEICSNFGLFIVPVGELESWFEKYGLPYSSNKSKWIVKALELIPSLKPNSDEEPWCFLQKVFQYLSNGKIKTS